MDDKHEWKKPERLKTLACNTAFPGRNLLLHQFVLNCSAPNEQASENFISAVLRCMADAPGSTVNVWNGDGYAPLHLATLKGNFLMVRKLLSCLVNINVDEKCRFSRDFDEDSCRFDTALHLATKLNDLSVIQELCDKGAGVDITNGNGETALYIAAKHGHLDAMKLLINQGANVNAVCFQETPLAVAARHGILNAVKYLVVCGAHVNSSACSPLAYATGSDNVAIVEFLISKGAAVNTEDEFPLSPLQAAARRSCTGVLECLLKSGADVNARGYGGHTPIHDAAFFGLSENAKILLAAGADINARDASNDTPLHIAVRERNNLIDTFLCLECKRKQDRALKQGKLKIARLLIDEGADLRSIDEEGKTPHHDTVYEVASRMGKDSGWDPTRDSKYRNNGKVIRTLLGKGADVSARNRNGKTPLDLARNQKSIDALRDIVQQWSASDDVLPAKQMKT